MNGSWEARTRLHAGATRVPMAESPGEESVACNLCAGTQSRARLLVPQRIGGHAVFSVVECVTCGLVYVNPRPSQACLRSLSPAYQAVIRKAIHDVQGSPVGRHGLRMMRRSRTPHRPPTDILDVGCSHGGYLDYLRGLGWRVAGIELDEDAARHARDVLALDVRTGDAGERLAELPDRSFDVVTLWHVLEHLHDPSGVLGEVNRVLRPGGSIVLEVPNADCLWTRLMGPHWFPWEVPYHLFHFSPDTLKSMLRKAGFAEVELRGEPAPAEATWSLHALWDDARGRPGRDRLPWHPVAVVLLYPIELILARLRQSSHLRAEAVKAG